MQATEFMKAARGEAPCDLLLPNARIVDVFSRGKWGTEMVNGAEKMIFCW
jgi:adenine deaminase